MALSISRCRVVLAALVLSPWLATPALAASVEPDGEVIEGGASAPHQPAVTVDWKGIRRDTLYFIGYEVVAVGVLHLLPEEKTHFNKEGAGFAKWRKNVTHPEWDDDDLYINLLLHPYWGAAYYIRGRERGLNAWESLGYSTLLSTIYEFGAEAFFEPVSYQDLIFTPLLGSLLGEFVFIPLRKSIKSKSSQLTGLDKFTLIMTDPLGAINDLVDRAFGINAYVSVAPMVATRLTGLDRRPRAAMAPENRVGWGAPDVRRRPAVWGLQLQIRW